MSTPGTPGQPEFSEEELEALEAEMDRITVDDVLLQTLVSLINLGARKAGLGGAAGAGSPQADLEQTRQAIEGARALMPLLESRHGEQLAQVREALSRLQMAYVQQSGRGGEGPPEGGEPGGGEPGGGEPGQPGGGQPGPGGQPGGEGAGPAQRTGRLWVPGQ